MKFYLIPHTDRSLKFQYVEEPIGRLNKQQGFRYIRNCRALDRGAGVERNQLEHTHNDNATPKTKCSNEYLNQKLTESQLLQKNKQFRLTQSAEVVLKLMLSVSLKREEGNSQGKQNALCIEYATLISEIGKNLAVFPQLCWEPGK